MINKMTNRFFLMAIAAGIVCFAASCGGQSAAKFKNLTNEEVNDALWVAVESEDAASVKRLLSKGADPNNVFTEWGATVLSLSCSRGNYDIAKLLIEAGAKADGADDMGFYEYSDYPVISAVSNDNIALVQLLIDNNCTISHHIVSGRGSIFEIAEENNNMEMLELLRKHSTTSDDYSGIPDSMFPIPMLYEKYAPYDSFLPPEEEYVVTTYLYSTDFVESYKEQLRNAGFVDHGEVQSLSALWIYERNSDGATLVVEMRYGEDENGNFVLSIGMLIY
jgi:ankyrin repeat protein